MTDVSFVVGVLTWWARPSRLPMNFPPALEEVFGEKWHVGNSKHLQSHWLVLSLILVMGRPVCPPFYQPLVLLEVVSCGAAEGIVMSQNPVVAVRSPALSFFQNNRASAANYFTFLLFMDAKPSPPSCTRRMEHMIHTARGVEVIGQGIGSVVSRCGVIQMVLSQLWQFLCLSCHVLPFQSWHGRSNI